MGAENFVNSEVDGKRGARRSRVLLAARLETPHGEYDARLRDLSRKGALVECSSELPSGIEVTFVRGSTRVPARIAWSAAGRLGLEFHFPIDEHEVLVQLKRDSSSEARERYSRPGLGQGMSAKDRKLAKAWGVAVGLALPDK